ncbi:hypothetical protein B8V81_3789 [Paenibacillus pasadenensis]|uniref:Uncharacterized protein n=1 Tax=Paenibacillus pasadenensis TaxID=217090 RepID=A0A2N5N4U1_9BACL|nr:hypothetical protein B8V81_3789 [Paenibacillus pasadenensis]
MIQQPLHSRSYRKCSALQFIAFRLKRKERLRKRALAAGNFRYLGQGLLPVRRASDYNRKTDGGAG